MKTFYVEYSIEFYDIEDDFETTEMGTFLIRSNSYVKALKLSLDKAIEEQKHYGFYEGGDYIISSFCINTIYETTEDARL